MGDRNGEPWDPSRPDKEDAMWEIKRLWESEIKGYFDAEEDFLHRYGRQAGYDLGYIGRVLDDHRVLGALVAGGREADLHLFSSKLTEHLKYKEEYLARHLDRLMGPDAADPSWTIHP